MCSGAQTDSRFLQFLLAATGRRGTWFEGTSRTRVGQKSATFSPSTSAAPRHLNGASARKIAVLTLLSTRQITRVARFADRRTPAQFWIANCDELPIRTMTPGVYKPGYIFSLPLRKRGTSIRCKLTLQDAGENSEEAPITLSLPIAASPVATFWPLPPASAWLPQSLR